MLLAIRKLIGAILLSCLIVACQPIQPPAAPTDAADNIVASVSSAPIVPTGAVAGAATDIVINLDTSLDPAVPGRTLLAGNKIMVTLPEAFGNTGLPGETIFTPDCTPPELNCSTAILLQGWPQHPILPMVPPGSGPPEFYTVSLDGTHTIVYTALKDVTPGLMLPGPGIKQLHMLAVGFVNPEAGIYEIQVAAETGPDGSLETGTARLAILPDTQPTISVTSVFTDGNPNTIYQKTSIGELTPLPYDFLLWDGDGAPFEAVDMEMDATDHATLRKGGEVVGEITIEAPAGATGYEITADSPSFAISAPVSGVPTARLTAHFRAGSEPGLYTLTISLNDGNSVTMYVTAE